MRILNSSLWAHPSRYHLSWQEVPRLFIKSPYAARHLELAKCGDSRYALEHKRWAYAESIPILGGLVSLIERVVALLLSNHKSSEQRMIRNFHKTLIEHKQKILIDQVDLQMHFKPKSPLSYIYYHHAAKGNFREKMEDAHFFKEVQVGWLMGVLDGHGEQGVIAQFAARHFYEDFDQAFQAAKGDFLKTMENLCAQIQQKIAEKYKTLQGGTTALICLVDPKTHLIYAATLGDSEAKIYRKIEDKIYSIPVSCVRNWSSPKDGARADAVFPVPVGKQRLPRKKHGKRRVGTLDVSRSLGDIEAVEFDGKILMSQKPKVTVAQLQPGDLVVCACDGLWDYAKPEQPLENYLKPHWNNKEYNMAECIVKYALGQRSRDNVTALALWIQ